MKNFLFIAVLAGTLLAGCKKKDDIPQTQITITTTGNWIHVYLTGKDKAIINWGDGSTETITLQTVNDIYLHRWSYKYAHTYSTTGTKTITIIGDITGLTTGYSGSITGINVSDMIGLKLLECEAERLTLLDVTQNVALEYLNCGKNELTSLDVSNNTRLQRLECQNNQISILDVSKIPALEVLFYDFNKFSSLVDVSNNPALKELSFGDNPFTSSSMEISEFPALEILHCNFFYTPSATTSFIISGSPRLWNLQLVVNNLDFNALLTLFDHLPDRTGWTRGDLVLSGNPGTLSPDYASARAHLLATKNW